MLYKKFIIITIIIINEVNSQRTHWLCKYFVNTDLPEAPSLMQDFQRILSTDVDKNASGRSCVDLDLIRAMKHMMQC